MTALALAQVPAQVIDGDGWNTLTNTRAYPIAFKRDMTEQYNLTAPEETETEAYYAD